MELWTDLQASGGALVRTAYWDVSQCVMNQSTYAGTGGPQWGRAVPLRAGELATPSRPTPDGGPRVAGVRRNSQIPAASAPTSVPRHAFRPRVVTNCLRRGAPPHALTGALRFGGFLEMVPGPYRGLYFGPSGSGAASERAPDRLPFWRQQRHPHTHPPPDRRGLPLGSRPGRVRACSSLTPAPAYCSEAQRRCMGGARP